MSALGGSELDSQLLGMSNLPSEDSVRGALSRLLQNEENEQATRLWLDRSFDQLSHDCLRMPWVLDVDVTVKPLYGKQEGAVLGYNPAKPGRPSH